MHRVADVLNLSQQFSIRLAVGPELVIDEAVVVALLDEVFREAILADRMLEKLLEHDFAHELFERRIEVL